MRIKYTYKSFPDCPQATKYSKDREASSVGLEMAAGGLTFFAIIVFLACTFDFFGEYNWKDFLSSLAFACAASLLDFYVYIYRRLDTEYELNIILLNAKSSNYPQEVLSNLYKSLREENEKEKMASAKSFFLFFFLLMFASISLIGAIKGLFFLCRKYDILSVIMTLLVLGVISWRFFKSISSK